MARGGVLTFVACNNRTVNQWFALNPFCQGDPFPHSPALLDLLACRSHWAEVQCLTAGYATGSDIPPANLRILEDDEGLGSHPLRTELCSAATLDMLGWQDDGGRPVGELKDGCGEAGGAGWWSGWHSGRLEARLPRRPGWPSSDQAIRLTGPGEALAEGRRNE